MNNKDFVKKLEELEACNDAIDFVRDNKYTLKQAWKHCVRADWMLWLMCRLEFATQKKRIHIICDCAATALKYVPKGEDRPRLAIEATRRYADNPTEENRAAAAAAGDAAGAAARAAAGAAAWAATGAAAGAAAWAATGAAAGDAAWAATGAAAGAAAHRKMCRMIRKKINP